MSRAITSLSSAEAIQQYIRTLRNKEPTVSDAAVGGGSSEQTLYGRIERCVINDGVYETPQLLSYRPHKHESVDDVPASFVMGSESLINIANADSLQEILEGVISLDETTVTYRLAAVQRKELDHLLILFTKEQVPTEFGDVEGLSRLLQKLSPESFDRFNVIKDVFERLKGSENFVNRRNLLSHEQWVACRGIKDCMWIPKGVHCQHPECGCEHYSMEVYCRKFDAAADNDERILETRKMLYIMLGCNEFYGFDGYTWDNNGNQLGEEYLAINRKIEDPIVTIFLSMIERFQI